MRYKNLKTKVKRLKNDHYRTVRACRSCKSNKLVDILSLGDHYLSDFTKTNKEPKKYPLCLILCETCNLLQLKHTAPQSSLYTERYGYKSGINNTMKKELKEIVEKSLKKVKDQGFKALIAVDIGANDGTLLSYYPKHIVRVGVEPIRKFAKECEQHADFVINNFFNYRSYIQKVKNKKAHIITAISCFYDIDNPNQFVSDVKKILHKRGVFVVQQNYLVEMLRQNAFDNILHEHLGYYSLKSLENLLNRHNLAVFDVEKSPINGGSFRTYISHKNSRLVEESVKRLREHEKSFKLNEIKIYKNFANRIKKNRNNLYKFIVNLVKKNKKVYIYGASTRGNTLLQFCNLDKSLISAAVERNSEKWGKKIASVAIPIISEEQARLENPDYMLVLPWFFKEEFLKREQDYLKKGGHFIFPLPTLEII
ncbi:MAG: class I SAM-dependent methyltransferase [Patescibacteria group bacterium]|mgnify:CR=1 FL=1